MEYLYLKPDNNEHLEIIGSNSTKNSSSFLNRVNKTDRVIYVKKISSVVTILIENLELFIDNLDLILSTPEYYQIPIEHSFAGAAYIRNLGRVNLFLGDLLTLWTNDKWTTDCECCSGKIYVISVGGSPLSGRGSATGYCSSCSRVVLNITSFSNYYSSAVNTLPKMNKDDFVIASSLETLVKNLKNNRFDK
ncbi:hypothetical protein EW093_00905 [Thiospirochaeta perfilievii]|uniref:Uncharacterized protein n=1 Tax=Thiospirochaeta perfilievii TaxID=252967 RepID=A0A5C1QAZ0_9SPIO|nr:hypothetical protein [Thiospirochaeta perfilievii]QEN03322.1 hypothetical protein EW093_00905 [Thiospirochaeta perfilievii]